MRTSVNQVDRKTNKIINGYDYDKQCWIIKGVVQRCGHPEDMKCNCYGRIQTGESI